MKKIIMPIMKDISGNGIYHPVHIAIDYDDGNLLFTGVEGALPSGECVGSFGQLKHLRTETSKTWKFCNGWTLATMIKFLMAWSEWNQNDMRVGTPAQRAFLLEQEREIRDNCEAACKALIDAGLYEDECHVYGQGYLKEEVPQSVIEWLFSLPDAEIPCAWDSL